MKAKEPTRLVRDLVSIAQRESADFLESYIGSHVLVAPPSTDEQGAGWTFDTRISGTPTSAPGADFPEYEVYPLRGRQRLLHRVVSIGRAPYNDLVIGDESVSKVHAKMEIKGEDVRLIDPGSSKGTLINGRALAPGEKQLLQHNDDITFGVRTFKFYRTARFHTVLKRLVEVPVLDLGD